MLQQSGLVVWDLALFLVVLAVGLVLRLAGGRTGPDEPLPLRKVFGRRLAVASLLFWPAAALDSWKPGVGVILWVAGMAGVLTWCMVTMCRHLDDNHPS